MKKIIIILVCIIIIALTVFFSWYITNKKEIQEIQNFNYFFISYINTRNNSDVNNTLDNKNSEIEGNIIKGVELTTLINKAIDNNEKYKIKKDEKGAYILNNENSLEILIKIETDGEYYLMEAFELAGMTEFTRLYGGVEFECVDTEYHENGRISKIKFDIYE